MDLLTPTASTDDLTTATAATTATSTPIVHHRHRPKISSIENQLLSDLLGYSGIILSCILCLLFLIRHYAFEQWLFPKYYRRIWSKMNIDAQRGFTNHHIGMGIKVFTLIVGAYPWVHILFGNADFQTPMSKGSSVSMGDLLLILTQLFCSMYIFELLFRAKISPISVAHHIGAIVIAQTGTVLSLDLAHQRDATIEFMLCLVWGAFDVLAELWPNVAIILYRVYNDNHYFLMNVFLGTCLITICGTIAESIMIFVFLAQSWSRWELSFKIVTPILHVVFSMAQVHGSRILFELYKKQKRLLAEEERRMTDPEGRSAQSKGKQIEEEDQIRMVTMSTPPGTSSKAVSETITQVDSAEGSSVGSSPKPPARSTFLGRFKRS